MPSRARPALSPLPCLRGMRTCRAVFLLYLIRSWRADPNQCALASSGRVFPAPGRRARIMSLFAAFVKKRCGSNLKVTQDQSLAAFSRQGAYRATNKKNEASAGFELPWLPGPPLV
jgi:hypothetical protein